LTESHPDAVWRSYRLPKIIMAEPWHMQPSMKPRFQLTLEKIRHCMHFLLDTVSDSGIMGKLSGDNKWCTQHLYIPGWFPKGSKSFPRHTSSHLRQQLGNEYVGQFGCARLTKCH